MSGPAPARRSLWRRLVRAETSIDAPAETVWSLLTDLAQYPSWNRFMPFMSGELRPGGVVRAEVRFRSGFLGLPFRFQAQVLRCDECREIRWTGRLFFRRLLSGVHSFVLESAATVEGDGAEDSSSRGVTLLHQEVLSGLLVPLVGWYLAPRMEDGFREMNEAIKARAESMA